MSFPRYPKYKDSGVEWLGEVPEHWEISRLGYESWVRARLGWKGLKAEEYVDDGFAFLSTPNIKGKIINFENVNFIDQQRFEESPEIILREGDVLLAKDGSTLGTANIVRFLPRPTTVNSSIAVISPNPRLCGVFLFYLFESSFMENTIQRIKGGMGVPHLFQADLNKFYLPIPPRTEQVLIGEFLDRETSKIDALVAEQQRLIDLLKEKRQTVISHAVTKGLIPDASMKPSGIEWLGDVPEHWEISRLGNLFREIAEPGIDDLPVLSVSIHHGVSDTELEDEELERKVVRSDDRSKYNRVEPGDLVYNMMRAWQGGFGTVAVEGMVSPAYVVARPRKQLSTTFVENLLRTPHAIEQMRRHSRGVTYFRLRLYWDEFKNIKIGLPPPDEANAICNYIASMVDTFNAISAVNEESIALLQERRTALISAVVTGKIDVRGLVETEAA